MKDKPLIPCVWCGGMPFSSNGELGFFVRCVACGYVLDGFDTTEEAESEWNGLPETADLRESQIGERKNAI
jgi:hypothetical protein